MEIHGSVEVSQRAPLLFSPNPLFFQIVCKYFTEAVETQLWGAYSFTSCVDLTFHALRSRSRWFCHVLTGIRVDIDTPSHWGSCFGRRGREPFLNIIPQLVICQIISALPCSEMAPQRNLGKGREGELDQLGVLGSTVAFTFHDGLEPHVRPPHMAPHDPPAPPPSLLPPRLLFPRSQVLTQCHKFGRQSHAKASPNKNKREWERTRDERAAEGEGRPGGGRKELQHEWHDLFQYNTEWFQDADEEDWELSKYHNQKEGDDLAAGNGRIRRLGITNDSNPLRCPATRVDLMMPGGLLIITFICPSPNPALCRLNLAGGCLQRREWHRCVSVTLRDNSLVSPGPHSAMCAHCFAPKGEPTRCDTHDGSLDISVWFLNILKILWGHRLCIFGSGCMCGNWTYSAWHMSCYLCIPGIKWPCVENLSKVPQVNMIYIPP